jgi:hypothetical protein
MAITNVPQDNIVSFPKLSAELDGQIDDLLCKIEGIGMALNATAEGLMYEQARTVLAEGLMDHLRVLRQTILPD